MYRKLVRVDERDGFDLTEVDAIKAQRVTRNLMNYVSRCVDPENDPYKLRQTVLPLCESILSGKIELPLNRWRLPYFYEMNERLLPETFEHYWSKFRYCVSGGSDPASESEMIDGIKYRYAYFEEPGDWPEKVEKHEQEMEELWEMRSGSTPEEIAQRFEARRLGLLKLKEEEERLEKVVKEKLALKG